jgi:hypothetical protein
MFIFAVFFAFLFQTTDTPNPNIWIENNEVWTRTAGGPRQLTGDSIPKRLPLLSPDGKRLIYVVDQPSPDIRRHPDQERIFEVDSDGKPLRTIIPKGYVPDRFERLDWIDERRIGAMVCGHANCFYWIIDADTGETTKTMQGGFDFVWSHNSSWVARKTIAEGEPGGELDVLLINDESIYPAADNEDLKAFRTPPLHLMPHRHAFGPFAWSPHDVWLAFTDSQSADDVYVVLVSPSGVIVHEKLAMPLKYGTAVEWTDDAHLQLNSGARAFRFTVNGIELQGQ